MQENVSLNYVTQVLDDLRAIEPQAWDDLLARQEAPSPFMQYAYLSAMLSSQSATSETGWLLQVFSLWRDTPDGLSLAAACPLYIKNHSRGEYVFDHAWADAYERHGLAYYPKALVASPFTPVPGTRLLAESQQARQALLTAMLTWCEGHGIPSLHILFASPQDLLASTQAGLLQRSQVQFHWLNQGWRNFDDFLSSLNQEKRKKIRQERRKVHEAGITFRAVRGPDMDAEDWALLLRCYQQTYWEHGNPPYLTPAFFESMRTHMARHWLLFVAERAGQPIAISLIGLHLTAQGEPEVAYGRYWGALERVDCLHFEACYYQPIEWCIQHGLQRFEGGAQGEHKMARALLPTPTHSAHWLAHPAFSEAVARFLERENAGIENYLETLHQHSPLKKNP
ncbi:GNAT family N-acetyltransferase [Limnohabitans sp. T6-5]|uniref:GNAT family N-acetyltransferase n=1 Tax=Limnohabitans sp. T6-5 TaxID=1100724 RepID=UPI000D35F158|nr:GNAT family N-acetyltransferase [Limnohabitans sp. T6-5]PUE06967.1 GNAT family N-acetyltransferase [Limnohabitans sp. T6-5]